MEVAQKVEEDEENQLMESKDLFELFDPDGKGFITKQDFHRLITQIPQIDESVLDIFECLDVETKGYLTYEQFSEGFEQSVTDDRDPQVNETSNTSNESSRINSDLYEQETVEESYDEDLINKILNILDSKDVNYINSVRKKWYALQSRDTDLILFMDELFKKVEQQKEHGRLSHVQLEAALKRRDLRSMAHQEEIRGLFEEIQIRQETEGALACDREQEKKLNEQLLQTVSMRELQLQEAVKREAELAAKLKQLERTEQMVKLQNEQLLRDKESLELKLRTSLADWDDNRVEGQIRSYSTSNLSLDESSTAGDQVDDEVFTDQPLIQSSLATNVPLQMTQAFQTTAVQPIPLPQKNLTAIKSSTTQISNAGPSVSSSKRVARVPASKHLQVHDDTDTDISDLPMSPEPRLYSISKQNWGAYQKQISVKPRPKDKSPQKKSKKSSCPVVPSSKHPLSRVQLSRQGSSLGDYFPLDTSATPRNQSVNCEDGEEIMLIVEPQLESGAASRATFQRRNSDRIIQNWSGTNGRRSDLSLECERQEYSHMDSSDEHNGNSLAIGATPVVPGGGGGSGSNTSPSEMFLNPTAAATNRATLTNQSNLQNINRPIRTMSDQSKITLARAMQNFATSLRKLPIEARRSTVNNLSQVEQIRRKTVASMFNLEVEQPRNYECDPLKQISSIDKHPKRHSIDTSCMISPDPDNDESSPDDRHSPLIEKLTLTKQSITNQWLRKIKTNLAAHEAANLERVGLNTSPAYGDQQYPHTGGHFGGDYDTETTSATNTASESEGGGGGGEGGMFSETDFDCSTIKSDSTYGLHNKGNGNLTDDTICSDAYPTILPCPRKKQEFAWKAPQQHETAVRRRKGSKLSPQIDKRKLSQKLRNRTSAEIEQPMMAGSIVRTRVYKIVFVGNSGSGKTSFIQRVCTGEVGTVDSMRGPPATVGVDYRCKNIYCDNFCYSLQLWDTAGQERFKAITRQYMRNADAMLVFYDVTDRRSFASVRSWMENASIDARGGGGGSQDQSHLVTLLIANKVDLRTVHSNCVGSSEGALLADEYDADFVEISVKADVNINECLSVLVSHLNQEESAKQRRLQLKKEKTCNSSKCCSSSPSPTYY